MLHAFHYAALERDAIGSLILARLGFELERSRSLAKSQAVHPQLSLATDFINRHYADPLSLDDVARAANVSVSHLNMLFRTHLGESPHQYLIQKRMRLAGHALATGVLSIKDVVYEVGFPNAENCCVALRKLFCLFASEYRRSSSRVTPAGVQ